MITRKQALQSVASVDEATVQVDQVPFYDTYTTRDYEVVLDILYGLFGRQEARKVRVFDPFIDDAQAVPLVTPRMLVDRIEAHLKETEMPKAS